VGIKPCSPSDTLHILKELKYTLPIIPHPEEYYFIYHMQTCFSIGFTLPMLNARIFIGILNACGRSRIRSFEEYLAYNIIYGYIVFNDGCGLHFKR
jgi:hypothetical protein